jgi:predicted HicB family RNase H-like nuclease
MTAVVYKGYTAHIEFDAVDELFVGRLAGINDVVGFHAETVEGLKTAFHEAVDDYIDTCARVGKTAEKPYSGKLMVRVAPEVHAQAALAAQLSGQSLNRWMEGVLLQAAQRTVSGVVPV